MSPRRQYNPPFTPLQEMLRVPLLPNQVHQGDCISTLATADAGSVDLAFADPPFNIGYEYDVYDDQRSRHDYLDFSRQWIAAVARLLRPSGTFWLAIGDEYAAELKLIAQEDVGLTCRSWVIWYYTFGVNCVRGFSRSHTHLFHFVKDPDNFTFNAENPAVRVPSARQLVYADARANRRGRLPDNTWILRPQDVPDPGFQASHDTWYFSRVAGTFKEREGFHGCQMPEQLLGRIIRLSSDPGDLVLDPFAGSGTTLAVAKKLGRQWIGVELSKEYVGHVRSRLDDCRPGDPLDGREDPRNSAPATKKGRQRTRFKNGRPVTAMDKDVERSIVKAYETSCKGQAADIVLCDPDLNALYAAACKKASVPGDASTWNHLLLRVRKSGKLPRATASGPRLGAQAMDPYSDAAEVAAQMVGVDYGLNIDEMLCSPDAAAAFDRIAEGFAGGFTPREYRRAAMALRKRAKRSRHLGESRDGKPPSLPRPKPLDRCTTARHDRPAVYMVISDGVPFYVGETLNLRARAQALLENAAWQDYRPDALRIFSAEDQTMRHGLQAFLVQRTGAPLNSNLLRAP